MRSLKPDFGDVARRELPVLYRVARRLAPTEVIAEDLVGQALVHAFSAWDRFDGRYPRSWLIAILRNEWNATTRKRSHRSEVDLESVVEPSDEDFWKDVGDQMDAATVVNELGNIPEDYRLAVTLCDVEELTYEEAAEALGIPIGTVRSRLHRGRKLLRSRLAGRIE